jgi:hypothetical protein
VPEPTPDYLATQRARAEEVVVSQLEELDLPTSGYLAWVQDEPISISLTGPGGQYVTFAESVNAADFVIYGEITWDTNAWPDCGLYFRADEKYTHGDYYWLRFLRFSGLPAFDIEYYRDGEFVTNVTQNVRFSDYLDISDGATNSVALSSVGNEFNVFINGYNEGRYYDYSSYLSQGYFAFLAYQDSGDTICTFDNSWIWLYE